MTADAQRTDDGRSEPPEGDRVRQTTASGRGPVAEGNPETGDTSTAPHPAFESYASEALPAASVGAPGKVGRLDLRFGTDADGQTALVRDFARTPFHVSGTLAHDPLERAQTVIVQSPSGGVVQGDRHDVSVAVRPEAVAHVSTGSATKVLSMERNYAAADLRLSVGAGGHLDYVPRQTILHAGARYAQTVSVDIDPAGTAVVGTVVVPGRLARGERFDFERYLSRVRVRGADGLLVADDTHLHPADADPTMPAVLGEFAVLGTLYVLSPASGADPLSDRLHAAADGGPERELPAEGGTPTGSRASPSRPVPDEPVRTGVSALPNDAGVAVFAVGHHSEPVAGTLWNVWDAARRALLGVGAPEDGGP